MRKVRISGTGSYLPEKRLTNADLAKLVATDDDWIVKRTGMRERRVAAPDQATSDLAAEAARRAVENAGLSPKDIDLIIVATVTPDTVFPSTACRVQHKLGARTVPCFDLAAACSGFIYSLGVAQAQIASGFAEHALIVGAEVLTRFTDYQDRGTCILFGDGAGDAVLSPSAEGQGHVLDLKLAADGNGADIMIIPGSGSLNPPSPETLAKRLHFIRIEGRAVFKQAVSTIVEQVEQSLSRCGLTRDDLDLIIPHQMNARIIESAAKHLDIPMEKVFVNLDKYGNTSAATITIALDEACRQGRIKKDDLLALVAFGGGLTWASALIRW